jgi:L-aminopeptidase/D-esterase-like protein
MPEPMSSPRGAPGRFDSTLDLIREAGPSALLPLTNTVIGVVATNATLTKVQATSVSHMAHDGIARAVRPAHTPVDGDCIFTLATGERREMDNVLTIGAFAAVAVERAIIRAVTLATGLGGVPSAREWLTLPPV